MMLGGQERQPDATGEELPSQSQVSGGRLPYQLCNEINQDGPIEERSLTMAIPRSRIKQVSRLHWNSMQHRQVPCGETKQVLQPPLRHT